jgi:hypothetical protein
VLGSWECQRTTTAHQRGDHMPDDETLRDEEDERVEKATLPGFGDDAGQELDVDEGTQTLKGGDGAEE